MPIGWFVAPYKQYSAGLTTLPARYCALDDFTPEIRGEGGDWREAEIGGGRALARVRASKALLARIARGSDVEIRRIDDPFLEWTEMHSAPVNRCGEIAFDSGRRQASQPLAELYKNLLDDVHHGKLRRRADAIARRADREGHVTLPRGDWAITLQLLSLLGRRGYGLDRVSTGTFPTTGLLDDFNRASIGSNWTALYNALAISSNQCAGTVNNAPNISYWNVATYGADSECYVTVATVPVDGANHSIILGARMKDMNMATLDGYFVTATKLAGTDIWSIYILTNGVQTLLGSSFTQEYSNTHLIGIEIIGSVIAAYYNGGSWSALASRTDATYAAAGYLFHSIGDTTGRTDNFSGGTVVPGGQPTNVRTFGIPTGRGRSDRPGAWN